MIIKECKIDTKYLDGEEYLYQGDEFNGLDPIDRDLAGKRVLEKENKQVRGSTYVRLSYQPGGVIQYWITTVNHKPSSFGFQLGNSGD